MDGGDDGPLAKERVAKPARSRFLMRTMMDVTSMSVYGTRRNTIKSKFVKGVYL